MVSKADGWMRIFDIPETSKHKGGFTIYKTISMLYPRNAPDSVTKVTVWKRYNDFKKLHNKIKSLCKSLKIKDKCPALPGALYFKRFNEDVIQERRTNILTFLEYLGNHPQLFLSDVCVQFFKTSYTPCDLLNSNIQSIRAELQLPVESEIDLIRPNSDDEYTLSDTDSISTFSSVIENLPDPLHLNSQSFTTPIRSINTLNSRTPSHDSLNISFTSTNVLLDSLTITEKSQDESNVTLPVTPRPFTNYVLDASHYIAQAIDYELSKKYEDAFASYKTGIDILLKNIKAETNFEHREMVRRKVEKYLLRAEKIYNIYLSSESKTIQNYANEDEEKEKVLVEHCILDLYKYKVIKVVGSGMLVIHSDMQQLYYIKVIHKTSKFSTDKLVLPGSVPYMITLYNYYDCENALFLVLKYCRGPTISEYIKQRLNQDYLFTASFNSNSAHYPHVVEHEKSDTDSENSYSNLIQEYALRNSVNGMEPIMVTADVHHGNEDHTSKFGSDDTSDNTLTNCTESNPRKLSRHASEVSEWSSLEDIEFPESNVLPLDDIKKWAAQLLVALERLHFLGVICCDLQSKNILINESRDLVLTYMCNVSEKYDIAFSENEDLILAPEMYSFNPVTEASDWWSYGAILYEWIVGMPLQLMHPNGLSAGSYLKIPKYVTVEARSLLKQLLMYEVYERLGCGINGADDIKSHPFFNSVIWEQLAQK